MDSIIVACFNPETIETVQTAIDGEITPLQLMVEKLRYKKIKELFKIKEAEVGNDRDLTNAVLSALAIKDLDCKQGSSAFWVSE